MFHCYTTSTKTNASRQKPTIHLEAVCMRRSFTLAHSLGLLLWWIKSDKQLLLLKNCKTAGWLEFTPHCAGNESDLCERTVCVVHDVGGVNTTPA